MMKERFVENGIEYVRNGDYYIPNLTVPDKTYDIGRYGRQHERYLKEKHPCYYSLLMMNGTLLEHLEKVDKTAKAELEKLIKAMVEKEGITEQLKADNQLKWVGLMNNIRHCAEEIINENVIYTRGIL